MSTQAKTPQSKGLGSPTNQVNAPVTNPRTYIYEGKGTEIGGHVLLNLIEGLQRREPRIAHWQDQNDCVAKLLAIDEVENKGTNK